MMVTTSVGIFTKTIKCKNDELTKSRIGNHSCDEFKIIFSLSFSQVLVEMILLNLLIFLSLSIIGITFLVRIYHLFPQRDMKNLDY